MKRSWSAHLEDTLEKTLDDTVPTLKERVDESHLPHIVNFVSTVALLPQHPEWPKDQRYNLPLKTISLKWGCSQYAPNLFAANIIKTKDSIASSTALLFVSGIMVVVSGLSLNHARYVSQYIRLNIENTTCMMKRVDEATGRTVVYEGSLKGMTTFEECSIHNIVGHGSVGMRIDLQSLVDAGPDCWKWFPDLFPGAKGKMWLTVSRTCECQQAHASQNFVCEDGTLEKIVGKKSKCICSVKVLVFDTGKVVITGARTVSDVNSIFKRISELAPRFESENQDVIPREERFYQRLSTMMIPLGGVIHKRAVHVERKELKPNEAVACVLAGIESMKIGKSLVDACTSQDATPLMRMAEAGRVNDVEMTLLMDPRQKDRTDGQGRTALQRLQALPEKSAEIIKIIKILE